MNGAIRSVAAAESPPLLREIPQPPQQLYLRGSLPAPDLKLLAVVGSRTYTTYGKHVVDHLIGGLAGYPVGIISGLALGIDSLAHEAALRSGLYTLAIPGGGLNDEVLYPTRHKPLARKILESGGGLLSEYEPDFRATTWSFPQRNRLVCGMSHATLLIEAAEKSGTLITARLATDYNRELMVVPGSIFSANSAGTHQFLKLGATPVTTSADILEVLNIQSDAARPAAAPPTLSPDEQILYDLLAEPRDRDSLIRLSQLPTTKANILLMQLEIQGMIAEEHGVYRRTVL